MDLVLIILGGIFLIVGFIGTVVPIIPGAPLAWAGLLISFFSNYSHSSIWILVVTGIIAIFVSIADNIFPVMMTKKAGGSKAGTIGSTIGLIIGLFLGPAGIILGPFIGAFCGELIHNTEDFSHALKAAFATFKGFLLGTGIKMIAVSIFIWIFIKSLNI